MDGVEVCNQLACAPEFEQTLITSSPPAASYSQVAGFDAGADDITNPYAQGIREQGEGLAEAQRQRQRPTKAIESNGVTLDLDQFLVRNGGAELRAAEERIRTPGPADQQTGKVFKRDKITRTSGATSLSWAIDAIDVRIRKLREKIDNVVSVP